MSAKLIVTVDAQIAALVPRFLANRAADVGKIRAALAGADFEAIRAAAHAMKGAGGAFGFAEISRLGAAMEVGVQQRDAATIAGLVTCMEDYLGRIQIQYADEQ